MSAIDCPPTAERLAASDVNQTLIKTSIRKKFQVVSTPIGDIPDEKNSPSLARLCGSVTGCVVAFEV